ncbi:hypothetical protein [Mycobacterium aquaticum]|uniref:Uncharacterized protein n=1 Tax=Mycobacterium aquaticum TaxID=1927124 RepID=A0A1X0A4A3_9MYCO|nr:hypothetical protein [Mycobacterium aquaticum]ORA24880.1 hypothetical protein BST13_33425 [Mycobacterium aquaticum]
MSENPLDGPEATPREVISDALGGGWSMADAALDALDRAGFSVVSRVWVAQLDLADGDAGYVAVHTTPEGAVSAVIRWAGQLGIVVDDLTTESGSQTLDAHPEVASYGVYNVPVER